MSEQPALAAPIALLVALSFERLVDDLLRYLRAAGYDDLRTHHIMNVFRFMDCGGTRPATLAVRAGITPQAMSEIVADLERNGYVRREPDPTDRRGRLVVYADRGVEAASVVAAFYAELEEQWSNSMGPPRLEELREALTVIAQGMGPKEGP